VCPIAWYIDADGWNPKKRYGLSSYGYQEREVMLRL